MTGTQKLFEETRKKQTPDCMPKIDAWPKMNAGGLVKKDCLHGDAPGALGKHFPKSPANLQQNINRNNKKGPDEEEDFNFPIPQQLEVGNAVYKVDLRLGKGGFGQVFSGRQVNGRGKKEEVALKLEHKSSKGCQNGEAPYEWQVYEQLGAVEGVPRVYHKGFCHDFFTMAMELLGSSLWDLWNKNAQRLSEAHVAAFAVEAIAILRRIHDKGFVHGDIKPENFLMGPTGSEKERHLYLVDLGLATKWRESNGHHVPYDQRPDDFRGTVRYASVHSHLGRKSSRRDDLESLVYTILFLVKGRLPWQGFQGDNKSFQVARKKIQTSTDSLCKGLASAFKEFSEAVYALKFDEEPEYDYYMYTFLQLVPKDSNLSPISLSDICNQVPKAIKDSHKRSRGEGDSNSGVGVQRKKTRHGGGGAQQWVSVYNRSEPMKQRYHYNVGTQRLEVHVQRGYEHGLRICAVCACGELWAVIMDAGTAFTNQVYTVQPNKFLPKEWIIERWEAGFYITAVAGASDGASLVVMSQGTKYTQQSYKVSDNFPYEWIKRKWKEGFHVTAMATCKDQWAVVMSRNAGFVQQVIEIDFQYPSEGIHKRWCTFSITGQRVSVFLKLS
eukprot:TRINITY_DN46137_c0_g2_i3.p1 TRINITY_DN46137_c0_g2~~TRINITY_DN46137_c0_g2_i3.p1  ORF type:complete len:611 (-),score=72.86 TRINITY_DN46137_c0_g2_i3:25-1857(-)